MNDRQENFFSMCLRVESRLDNNLSIVSTIAALNTARTSLKNQIANIRNIDLNATKNITGVSEDKQSLKSAVINSCLQLSSAICSYAASINNNTVYQEIYKPASSIEKLRDDQLPTYAAQIIQRLNEFLANLADYGITSTTLSNFTNLVSNYNSTSATPRVATATKKTANENLANQIKETRTFLIKNLDKLVKSQKATFPDFVSEYFNDRIIYDDGKNGEVISSHKGNLNPSEKKKVVQLAENTKRLLFTILEGGPVEIGLSVNGVDFTGNTSTLSGVGSVKLEIDDLATGATSIIVRNQSTTESATYKVQQLK